MTDTPSTPNYRDLLSDEEKLRYDARFNPDIGWVTSQKYTDPRGHPLENNYDFQEMMLKPLVYYAHCTALYDTPQEERDIELLKDLGFAVLNPNAEEHQKGYQSFPGMGYFEELIHRADLQALAFRALPDGQIPAGVWAEIDWARCEGIPVFEIPTRSDTESRRRMTVEDTRAYLKECGKR